MTHHWSSEALFGSGEFLAQSVNRSLIAWSAEQIAEGDSFELWACPDGAGVLGGSARGDRSAEQLGVKRLCALTVDPGGIPAAAIPTRAHLAGYAALRLSGVPSHRLREALRGQLLVARRSGSGELNALTGVQIAGMIDDLYAGARKEKLGVTWNGDAPAVALWAPTARQVRIAVTGAGDGAGAGPAGPVTGAAACTASPATCDATRAAASRTTTHAMTRDGLGIWHAHGTPAWKNASYLFEVEVVEPRAGTVVTYRVTGPYAVALTVDSERAVFVDLGDPAYHPELWRTAPQRTLTNPAAHTIYELHVRDFSMSDPTVPEHLRGKYGAFTLPDSAGMRHLRALAAAGMTTVHLLPTFDIATIPERPENQKIPRIPPAAPDSPAQQQAVSAVADSDAYNWGYDPFHYLAPEGSYAVEPNGGARIEEFRAMVGGLHAAGLGVVLDQVYNHTAAAGGAPASVLDKVVPGYYYRLDARGTVATSTCCPNVATENLMAEKLMVDAVVLWAKYYRVDGFRFDLMGHHTRANMEAVRAALDALTVERDGIDGARIYLYGEGWNFGEVADNARFRQATQLELNGTGIGAFNDRLRDAVHGGGPFDSDKRHHQGYGTGLFTDPNGNSPCSPEENRARFGHATDLVKLSLAGALRDFRFRTHTGEWRSGAELDYGGRPAGFASQPQEAVNYVDAHDNETLWDIGAYKLPLSLCTDDRIRMALLALATVALGQAPAFWHAGTELLRSKSLDRDSYNSGDHFNRLDFSGQSNNFGVGLPPASRNEASWPVIRPLLARPELRPSPEQITRASAIARDLLRLRHSSPLITLGSAELIRAKVSFPNGGRGATPGLIIMRIDDTAGPDIDPQLAGIIIAFNASPRPITEKIEGVTETYELSPIQLHGYDDAVRAAALISGTVTVPARSVAVFLLNAAR
ncbi:pullulanase-type alpha-1,6-glucosidase [Actinotignum sp. GS-2025b]|uniref:pullulanase-type alpha-1,6-glucosidase n=1 Tax=Actinotignum sp. GS-2025b TaxID=3427275 RepID=UPI003F46BE75